MAEDLLYSEADELRMPRSTPGVPDKYGFVFYGPIGTGQVSVADAMWRSGREGYLKHRAPDSGAFMQNDAVLRETDRGRGIPSQEGIERRWDRNRRPVEQGVPGERHTPAMLGREADRVLGKFGL